MKYNIPQQYKDSKLMEKEEIQSKVPQLKVRTDIRSGYCVWVDVPPLTSVCS